LYREIQDTDGLRASLFNLMEVQRYLGNSEEAVRVGDELVQLLIQLGMNSEPLKRKVDLLRRGEPALRVVCVRNGVDFEIDEISTVTEKQQELQFRRNRPSLHLAIVRTKQGTTLGSEGKLDEALAKFQEASQIDPYDPDPIYQSAVGYLELGQYAKAREMFDEVERLAPGWYHCRSDRWLAKSLEDGKATEEQFKVLRVLEGGKATADQAMGALQQMLAKDPTFTPYYLLFGDYLHEQKDLNNANLVYRKGLTYAAEPDIQCRLLVAAGAILTKESPDRAAFLNRAIALNGNLVATATAKLLLLA
jgi:tetratricopeptide (TPR) repeat protein